MENIIIVECKKCGWYTDLSLYASDSNPSVCPDCQGDLIDPNSGEIFEGKRLITKKPRAKDRDFLSLTNPWSGSRHWRARKDIRDRIKENWGFSHQELAAIMRDEAKRSAYFFS
jgi:hypothetical protein